MFLLILGLVLFLGQHLLAVMAPDLRARLIAALGLMGFKIAYSLCSVLTLALLVYGFAQAPFYNLWFPPQGMAHLTVLLMLFASICLFAGLLPAGNIKVKTRHPLILAVKIWATAHLFSNGDLRAIIVFIAFLAWGVVLRIALKRRERAGLLAPPVYQSRRNDGLAVLLGALFWAAMLGGLHEWLIGVAPLQWG